MTYVEVLAQTPRPLGSPENAEARDYLVQQLTSLGLTPEIQTAQVSRTFRGGRYTSGTVNNILARLPGTDSSRALLLAAHYDSVVRGPGASDDAAGVAALMETLRALRTGQPLKNDVIFLFSDGEERGLLGAKAFVDQHPAAKDVGLALNFEARGSTGPSYMFETSDENGWLIREFAKVAPYPVGYSLTYDVYRLLPNDTDFTLFKGAGIPGLNFAFIDGYARYHTETDSIANVDRRSLQHHGSYALSLSRHFGNLDLTDIREPNAVYFRLLGVPMVRYSQAWLLPLLTLAVLGFVVVVGLGLRRKLLTPGGIAMGVLAWLGSVIVGVLLVQLLLLVIPLLHSGPLMNPQQGSTVNGNLYAASFVAFILASSATMYNWLGGRILWHNLTVGAWLWWLVLLIVTTVYLPSSSYLFTWPLLFGLLALGYHFLSSERRPGLATTLLVLLPATAALLLFVPTIYGIFVALTINLFGAVGLFVALVIGLLLPALRLMTSRYRWLLPIASAVVGMNLLIFAALTSGV